jgi:hypothetical protein
MRTVSLIALSLLAGSGVEPAPLAQKPHAASALVDGDFEQRGSDSSPIPGWTLELGAQNGATSPLSRVELDTHEKHGGKASLRFAGDATTAASGVKGEIEVRPGSRYELEAWTRPPGSNPTAPASTSSCSRREKPLARYLWDAAGNTVSREIAEARRSQFEMKVNETLREATRRAQLAKGSEAYCCSAMPATTSGWKWPPTRFEHRGQRGHRHAGAVFHPEGTSWKSTPLLRLEEAVGANAGTVGQDST